MIAVTNFDCKEVGCGFKSSSEDELMDHINIHVGKLLNGPTIDGVIKTLQQLNYDKDNFDAVDKLDQIYTKLNDLKELVY